MVCLFALLSILNLVFQTTQAALLGPSSPCVDSSECESGVCALSEPVAGAPKMCCRDIFAATYFVNLGTNVCKELADGTPCIGMNSFCASDICGMDGLCTSEKLASESECDDHVQCESGTCGLSEPPVAPGAPPKKVCCKDTSASTSIIVPVCEELVLADGKPCTVGWNGFCASGVCGMDGLCTSEKLAFESECDNHPQCESGTCALSEPVAGASKMCCKEQKYFSSLGTFVCDHDGNNTSSSSASTSVLSMLSTGVVFVGALLLN